jgi:hypothetical protein
MAVLHCVVFSINDQRGGDNSTVEVPLLNNQNMPLVAMFDTTNLNKAVKSYIKTTKDARTHAVLVICLYELLGNPTT